MLGTRSFRSSPGSRQWWSAALVTTIAASVAVTCSVQDVQPERVLPRSTAMPALEPVGELVQLRAVENLVPQYAVSSSGMMAYAHGPDASGRRITLTDSSGSPVARFLRMTDDSARGSDYLFLEFGDDETLLLVELFSRQVTGFNGKGNRLFRTPLGRHAGIPVRLRLDSMDFAVFGANADYSHIARVDTRTGSGRTIVDLKDDELPFAIGGGTTFASTGDLVVVGDPYEYRFASYTADGVLLQTWGPVMPPLHSAEPEVDSALAGKRLTDLERAAERQRLLSQRRPHFRALAFDGRQRMWAIGSDSAGGFADVFADTTHLGRLQLPCVTGATSISVRGDKLGLICAPRSVGGDPVLTLYRIVE